MENFELMFGLFFLAHREQQVSVFAPEFEVVGIELERSFKFVDVRVCIRQKFARFLGDAGRFAARRRQQQKIRVFGSAQQSPDAAQIEHQRALGGTKLPGYFILFRGEI
jgi:hypothetical protein